MTPQERYKRVQDVLEAARLLESSERQSFLMGACGSDDALRAEVESLLRHETAAAAAMPTKARAAGAAGARPLEPSDPESIGPYRIISVLGDGGFGVVYLAEQTEPVRRRVAVKVIKPGMDSRAVLARFEQERQALALMDHPGVARVYDAGVTAAGRPFFVMEHVRGEPITAFCDRLRLGLEERVRLFMRVCEAVQHAHQKGVVHRDLKPSNILVEYEGPGGAAPKIIDFGVAKALNQRLTERTVFTEQGQLIGTPEYMSPEQAEMSGLDIDTRSDIYSLGVLLYEMLTGTLPFDPRTLRSAGFAEVQRIIREVDPPRPSVRLSVLTHRAGPAVDPREAAPAAHDEAARMRRTDTRRLIRTLRGDLDWVVMRCLEKDRQRRYESASGLAADLGRYLRHEPVAAGPPRASYRIRKFARRNRVFVGAAAIAGAALVAAAGVSIAFAISESRQRRIAERMTESAQRAAAAEQERTRELTQVVEFQSSMISGVDPAAMGLRLVEDVASRLRARLKSEGRADDEVRAALAPFERALRSVNPTEVSRHIVDGALLRPAVATIETRFRDQPLVEASLRRAAGQAYRALGMYDAAADQLRRSLDLRKGALGPADRATLESMQDLGLVLHAAGNAAEAEPVLSGASETCLRVLGEDDPSTLSAMDALALSRQALGRLDDAEGMLRAVLDKRRRVLGEDAPDTLRSWSHLGDLLRVRRNIPESERCLREAYARRERTLGPDHRETLQSMVLLGGILRVQGRLDDAAPFYSGALEGFRRTLGDDHPDTLNVMNRVAIFLFSQKRLGEAEPLIREAAERYDRTQPDNHLANVITLNTLGAVLNGGGKSDEAAAAYRRAIEHAESLPDTHPDKVRPFQNLGTTLAEAGKAGEGEPLLARADAIARRALKRETLEFAQVLTDHADALRRLGRYTQAELLLIEADSCIGAAVGPSDPAAAGHARAVAAFYTEWEQADPAKGHDASAETWRAKAAPPSDPAAPPSPK